jgi:hypothetical protein
MSKTGTTESAPLRYVSLSTETEGFRGEIIAPLLSVTGPRGSLGAGDIALMLTTDSAETGDRHRRQRLLRDLQFRPTVADRIAGTI